MLCMTSSIISTRLQEPVCLRLTAGCYSAVQDTGSRHGTAPEEALAIAHWLEQRPEVEEVYYIGLDSRPDKELIDRQCSGYGGMISFRLNSAEKAVKILESVKLIRFAESLGGVESLLTYPMKQTHADVPVEVREALGVDEKLLRMSVGIENIDDLLADLVQAFA